MAGNVGGWVHPTFLSDQSFSISPHLLTIFTPAPGSISPGTVFRVGSFTSNPFQSYCLAGHSRDFELEEANMTAFDNGPVQFNPAPFLSSRTRSEHSERCINNGKVVTLPKHEANLSEIMGLTLFFAVALAGTSLAQNINSGPSTGYNGTVGTNTTTNATYSNPIMTLNVGDP